MGKSVTTSVRMDEELWKIAKKAAIDKRITLQGLLNEAVKDWTEKNQEKQV